MKKLENLTPLIAVISLTLMAKAARSVKKIDNKIEKLCGYQKIETALQDKVKGDILSLKFIPYERCKSKCDKDAKCKNFEYCPSTNRCRTFDGQVTSVKKEDTTQFFDCYASFRSCK